MRYLNWLTQVIEFMFLVSVLNGSAREQIGLIIRQSHRRVFVRLGIRAGVNILGQH